MLKRVSKDTLLALISEASRSGEGVMTLRKFVNEYYEGDRLYLFQSNEIELIFAVLASYLEFEESFSDPQRGLRLKRLENALTIESSPESAIAALESDRVSELLEKLDSGTISEFVFEKQLRKLSAVDVNWKKVVRFHRDYSQSLSMSPAGERDDKKTFERGLE